MAQDRILIIAPHCLDEVLGCGGTIAKYTDAGASVEIMILFGDGTGHDQQRRMASKDSAKILGSKPPHFAGFPENLSDTVPLTNLISKIEREVERIKPNVVFVSHIGNLHIDHQNAFKATATALRPVPGISVREFYSYETPSSTDWAPVSASPPFLPNRFIDISETFDHKKKALECYDFEMRPKYHARSFTAVNALATTRGAAIGVAAAEAFMIIRQTA